MDGQFAFCASLIVFAYVCLSSECGRSQVGKVLVNSGSTTGCENEPSVVVRPWDTDGKFLISSWQYSYGSSGDVQKDTKTSKSTDGGATWSSQTTLPIPSGGSYNYVNDAVVAYRHDGTTRDGSGNAQLIATYRSFNRWNTGGTYPRHEGTFIAFSSNDGSAWGSAMTVETNTINGSSDPAEYTTRPSIATDNNATTSSYVKNAYVCWTHTTADGTDIYDHVRVARVSAGATTVSSVQTLINGGTATNDRVDACAITVASDGTVYLLWRRTHTDISPETRDLYLATSSDGGANWNTTAATVVTSSPESGSGFTYEDFPALTISKASSELVFVTYTEGTSSPTSNPSDLLVTSASVSSLGTWSTPWNIGADAIYGNLQFQPAICPDGLGGVFILYYSQTVGHTGGELVRAVVYEGLNSTCAEYHHAISNPIGGFSSTDADAGKGIGDYISIAFNPVLKLAHPVWTDINPTGSTDDIYTIGIGQPLQGTTYYCNQRKVVGDDAWRHLVVAQVNGTTYQITYQRSPEGNINLPIEEHTWSDDSNYKYYAPSIALYSLPGTFDITHRSLCVTWEGISTTNTRDRKIFYITANSTDAGTSWSWSSVGTYPLTLSFFHESGGTNTGLITGDNSTDLDPLRSTPVVAPLITDEVGSAVSCAGFAIFWGNGVYGIRSIGINTSASQKYPDYLVSDMATDYRYFHPSCVTAWYGATTSYSNNLNRQILGDRSVHVAWEAGNDPPFYSTGRIFATEIKVDVTGTPWVASHLAGDIGGDVQLSV